MLTSNPGGPRGVPRRLADADAILASTPADAFLNSGNDGNEAAAFEAALRMAWELPSGRHDELLDPTRCSEAVRLSGLARPPRRNPLRAHRAGGRRAGRLFLDDPNFRLFRDGLTRLFMNAVLFAPGL